jgi:hypothetical protein
MANSFSQLGMNRRSQLGMANSVSQLGMANSVSQFEMAVVALAWLTLLAILELLSVFPSWSGQQC